MTTNEFEIVLTALITEYESSNDNAPLFLGYASIEATDRIFDFDSTELWEAEHMQCWNGESLVYQRNS